MAEIALESITKRYEPDAPPAVEDVSLIIADGELVALVGPSGCGKSTILRMVAGLERVTSGTVRIGGRDVTHLPPKDRDISMVFQDYALFPQMTVRRNLAFGLTARKLPRAEVRRRVEEVAGSLRLTELLDRKPLQLSGGQRQRVAIGRAIIRDPQAFLMDEPLSNLDANLRTHMRGELVRLRQRLATTTLYVTHDQVEAMTLGDRVVVLNHGRVQQVDTPRGLFDRPRNTFVAATIGSPSINLLRLPVREGSVSLGDISCPLPPSVAAVCPEEVVLGVRPADFEDAAFGVRDGWVDFKVVPDVVEMLGSETHVHFELEGAPVDTGHGPSDDGVEEHVGPGADPFGIGRVRLTAVVDGSSTAASGYPMRLAARRAAFHYFDPVTGERVDAG